MRTTTQELLHLRGSDFSALPCIGPGGFGRRWVVVDGGEFGGLFGSAGLFAPKDTGEKGHSPEWHRRPGLRDDYNYVRVRERTGVSRGY